MDGTSFDRLTKTVAGRETSRRTTLHRLTATILGGALAGLSLEATAACRPVGGKCKRDRNCCEGEVCTKGRCKCAPGRKDCDGDKRCETDVKNDDDNCGACGNACPFDQECREGQCVCRGGDPFCNGVCCEGRDGCCDGVCRDFDFDPTNCGDCGVTCPAGQVCDTGKCCVALGGGCTSTRDCCFNTSLVPICRGGICERRR
jgi:hypothetical protein